MKWRCKRLLHVPLAVDPPADEARAGTVQLVPDLGDQRADALTRAGEVLRQGAHGFISKDDRVGQKDAIRARDLCGGNRRRAENDVLSPGCMARRMIRLPFRTSALQWS